MLNPRMGVDDEWIQEAGWMQVRMVAGSSLPNNLHTPALE